MRSVIRPSSRFIVVRISRTSFRCLHHTPLTDVVKGVEGLKNSDRKVVIANEVKQSRIIALRLPRALRALAMTGRIE